MRYLLRTVSLAALSTCATLQWLSVEAYAQQPPAMANVVGSCATISYTVGTVRPITVNSNGSLCDTGSGGGGGGGTSAVDEAAFTQGTTAYTPIGGVYTTSLTTLTSGQGGVAQLTSDRSLYINFNRIAGNSVAVGTGASSTGTMRVVLSTDSALAANQSVNTAQVNGVTVLTGTGAVGTGSQRIAVGTDTATIAGSAPGTAGTA